MAEFVVNPERHDPYKNFKFRIKWDGRYVAGVSKCSALKRTVEVVKFRESNGPGNAAKMPALRQGALAAAVAGGGAGAPPEAPAIAYEQQVAQARGLVAADPKRGAQVVKSWVSKDE